MDQEGPAPTRRRRFPFGWLFACAVAIIVIAAGVANFGWLTFKTARLKAEGDGIVHRLEEYKARTGAYPPDLPTAGIEPPVRTGERWTYYPVADGFLLTIRHDGLLVYDPGMGWVVVD